MPVTRVGSKWEAGSLTFYSRTTGEPLLTVDDDGVTIHKLKGIVVTNDFPVADQDDEATVYANSGVLTVSSDGE